jgi:hypothetical protein
VSVPAVAVALGDPLGLVLGVLAEGVGAADVAPPPGSGDPSSSWVSAYQTATAAITTTVRISRTTARVRRLGGVVLSVDMTPLLRAAVHAAGVTTALSRWRGAHSHAATEQVRAPKT